VHPTEAAAVAEEVERLVRDWHRRLSVFEPASAVSIVNRLGAAQPVSVDQDLFALIERCLAGSRATRGTFDITVGSLMRARGFRASDADGRDGSVAWGAGSVVLDRTACTVRFLREGIALDLGGVAKGFVLDLARDELAALGVTSAIIHGGTSSVLAVGARPDGRPWRVRAMPDDPEAPVIELEDCALSVSSPSGRTVDDGGHILDPVTGFHATGVEAACVLGPSAETCEIWSTALVVDPSLTDALPDGYGCRVRIKRRWRSHADGPALSLESR
jgi:thiamine biosynthesis lipoprotein